MRFLVIQEPKDEVVGSNPPGEMLESIIRHMKYYRDLEEKGKVVEKGGFAGLRGGFGIFRMESLEELNRVLNFAPASQYMKTKIYPLVSMEDREEQLKKMLESVKGEVVFA